MASAALLPRPTLLRGTLPDWRRVLAGHYARLGRRSRQRRFMANLPDRVVRRIADSASPDAVLGVEAGGRIVGVLEIFRGADGHAEIGISVEDAFQGRGYGRALFLDGLAAAEAMGVQTADLYFSCDNSGLRKLVDAAGGRVVHDGADCEAHIDIAHCAACHATLPRNTPTKALPCPIGTSRRLDLAETP